MPKDQAACYNACIWLRHEDQFESVDTNSSVEPKMYPLISRLDLATNLAFCLKKPEAIVVTSVQEFLNELTLQSRKAYPSTKFPLGDSNRKRHWIEQIEEANHQRNTHSDIARLARIRYRAKLEVSRDRGLMNLTEALPIYQHQW